MKPFQCSGASSPLVSVLGTASIYYEVLDYLSLFDLQKRSHGVASSYLSGFPVGGKVYISAKPINTKYIKACLYSICMEAS